MTKLVKHVTGQAVSDNIIQATHSQSDELLIFFFLISSSIPAAMQSQFFYQLNAFVKSMISEDFLTS